VFNLEYGYDLAGRRTAVSGSLANEQLPAAVSSATYNANNQLTQWGSTAMSYDLNGNTLNDGMNSYVWDARNNLVSADSSGATFSYDPLGRRMSKTMLSTTTNFLYDGANPVQEQNGSGVTANLLTGGVDERFQRTDSTGTYDYLSDALESTMALTDSTGAEQTTYSYGPYGVLSATGTNSNDYMYSGREADGLGIDYYRARYYNPQTGRFLSEDPFGFDGSGPNLYAYASDNPISISDPFGLQSSYSGPYGPPQPLFPMPWGCVFSLSCFYYYGNYGGPGWTGGQWQPWEDFGDPWSSDPNPPAGLALPTNAQDACYMDHDRCYARARHPRDGKCSKSQESAADRSCDGELMYCLMGVNSGNDPSSNFFSKFAQPIFSIKELLQ